MNGTAIIQKDVRGDALRRITTEAMFRHMPWWGGSHLITGGSHLLM